MEQKDSWIIQWLKSNFWNLLVTLTVLSAGWGVTNFRANAQERAIQDIKNVQERQNQELSANKEKVIVIEQREESNFADIEEVKKTLDKMDGKLDSLILQHAALKPIGN